MSSPVISRAAEFATSMVTDVVTMLAEKYNFNAAEAIDSVLAGSLPVALAVKSIPAIAAEPPSKATTVADPVEVHVPEDLTTVDKELKLTKNILKTVYKHHMSVVVARLAREGVYGSILKGRKTKDGETDPCAKLYQEADAVPEWAKEGIQFDSFQSLLDWTMANEVSYNNGDAKCYGVSDAKHYGILAEAFESIRNQMGGIEVKSQLLKRTFEWCVAQEDVAVPQSLDELRVAVRKIGLFVNDKKGDFATKFAKILADHNKPKRASRKSSKASSKASSVTSADEPETVVDAVTGETYYVRDGKKYTDRQCLNLCADEPIAPVAVPAPVDDEAEDSGVETDMDAAAGITDDDDAVVETSESVVSVEDELQSELPAESAKETREETPEERRARKAAKRSKDKKSKDKKSKDKKSKKSKDKKSKRSKDKKSKDKTESDGSSSE